jgi:hypothetical protein
VVTEARESRPWTQEATLLWQPRVSVSRRLLDFVEALETQGQLRGYRLSMERISGRIASGGHVVEAWGGGVTVRAFTPEADMDALEAVVQQAFDVLAPPPVRQVVFEFQHLSPLAADYNSARKEVANQLTGSFASDSGLVDFALMIDGEAAGFTHASELGVLSQAEIPDRLGGRVASLMARQGAPGDPGDVTNWEAMSLPAVALYMSSRWSRRKFNRSLSAADDVQVLWGEAEAAARNILNLIRIDDLAAS